MVAPGTLVRGGQPLRHIEFIAFVR
jgi:hypothetical protein